MRKTLFICVQFIGVICFAQNTQDIKQTLSYKYELSAKTSKTNPENIKITTCSLDILDDMSVFYDQNQYERNKLAKYPNQELSRQERAGLGLSYRPIFKWMVISQDNQNKFLSQVDSDFKYMTVEPIELITWTIDPQTSSWNEYTVQKATTTYAGRDWTVLFTQDIAVNSGPYKFNNLPGLVVKAWDSEDHYIFELINSGKSELDLNVISLDDYPLTDSKKIKKALDIYRNKTYLQTLEEKGIKIGDNGKARLNTKISEDNNDIERI